MKTSSGAGARLLRACARTTFCIAALTSGSAGAAPAEWLATATRAPAIDPALLREPLAAGAPIHVVVGLALRERAALEAFVAEAARPGSPAYGRWLSPEQFLASHSPTAAAAEALAQHLRAAGFVNVALAPNRLLLSADGTAATARQAFRTELVRVALADRASFANTRAAQLPAQLAGVVSGVLGLQDVERLESNARIVETAAAAGAQGFSPIQFPRLYGVGSVANASQTAVGIITAGNMAQTLADFQQFQSSHSLPPTDLQIVYPGAQGTDTSGTLEWDLDTQSIVGMSGGVKKLVLYAATSLNTDDISTAFNRAVTDHAVKLVNVSLGLCEASAQTAGMIAVDDAIFSAGAAQGLFFSIASGDSGSHECRVLLKTKANVSVQYPSSSPTVVAVGGTTLLSDGSGNYASETAWSGSGGGFSKVEARPAYQNGIVAGSFRGVPDIALDGDPNTGALIVFKGNLTQVGGTSLSSPLFVGLYARIESATGNAHGLPNAGLYAALPGNPTLAHDVVSGSNGPSGFYTAGAGWDAVTGFGSPVIAPLANYVATHPAF